MTRFGLFETDEEEQEALAQVQSGLLKLVAWQGLERAHQKKADEYRTRAGEEEQLAAEGR